MTTRDWAAANGQCRRDVGFGCPCGEPATRRVITATHTGPAECIEHARERFAWCKDAAMIEVTR